MRRIWLILALFAFGCDDQPNEPPVDAISDSRIVDVGGLDATIDRGQPDDMASPDDMAPPDDMASPDDMAPPDDMASPDDMAPPVDDMAPPVDDMAPPVDDMAPPDPAIPDMAPPVPDMDPPIPDMAPPVPDMAPEDAEVPDAELDAAIDAEVPDAAIDAAIDAEVVPEDADIPPLPDVGPGVLEVRILQPLDGAEVPITPIAVSGTITEGAALTINGVEVIPDVDRFAVDLPLQPGLNQIVARATLGEDTAEHRITVTYTVDERPPQVRITAPNDGQQVLVRRVDVTGVVDEPAAVRVGDVDAQVAGQNWIARGVALEEGRNVIEAVATDLAGNVGRAQITITVDSIPADIEITEPEDGLFTGEDRVTVRGRVAGDDVERVEVDGVEVAVAPDGTWSRADVPLQDGRTVITAAVTDAFGNVGLAQVAVIRDGTPPTIHIETPRDGATLNTTQIDVAGVSNDFITGITIDEADLRVWVNGQPAMVLNRTFTLADLLLQRGPNTITVEAEDRAGNRSTRQIEVVVAPEAGQRLVLISGQSQGARSGEPLRDPLTVSLLDAAGNPVAGAEVQFEVSRGDGTLEAFPESGRALTVTTDDNGLAGVSFVPGRRTGAGSQRVRATAAGYLGEVEFCTSVFAADPAQVLTVSGDLQSARIGTGLPEPLSALVTDAAGNPVRDVEVTFTAVRGDGGFGGQAEITVTTDGDGLARVTPTLGAEPGANVFLATIPALQDPGAQGAAFRAEALVPGDRARTRVIGQVLDNQDQPIPGVTAWIRLEAGPIISDPTDADGHFAIDDVPVGAIHLVVDGTTAEPEGEWPRLTYDLITVAGADNGIGGPIYLPRLDPDASAVVGGDEDVTLRLTGVEGAELTVFANSVTCLDGGPECRIIWSQVRGERVPDPIPMGSAADMVATLQPPGVRFDPPARLCIPNRGNPPGYQQEMFAYDHDLGDWVGLGTGTVTTNGEQICSDEGFGLHKAGWHAAPPPPPPPKCPSSCDNGNPCQTGSCKDGACVYEPKGDGTKCDDGSGCGEAVCQGGSCVFQSTEADGTACDDSDECTQSSECQGGACVGSDPLDCDDGVECTDDSCDPAAGCQNDPKADGASCEGEAGEACVERFECQGGACTPIEKECEQDDNECTESVCEEGECVDNPVSEGEACGDSAEGDDQCGQYTCQEGECAPAGDSTEGEECDDESDCTEDDRCQQGECKGDERPKVTHELRSPDLNFAVRIPQIASAIESAVSRFAPFKFRFGGDVGIRGQSTDCCVEDTGEFIEEGKLNANAFFNIGARLTAPVGPLGFVQDIRFDQGGVRGVLQVEAGVTADLTLTLNGDFGAEKDLCVEQGLCIVGRGGLSAGGALRLGVFLRACLEAGALFSICPNIQIEPARLQVRIGGNITNRGGGCANPGTTGVVTIGEVKFVSIFNLIFTQYRYERVLFAGFRINL